MRVMTRARDASSHEEGLALFISPEWRPRFRQSLADEPRRAKMLDRLAHFRHLDQRFATQVERADQDVRVLAARLRGRGAGDACHVLSEDEELDGRAMALDAALREVLHTSPPTFISCIPGRLAYFHDEEPDNRYILERPG